jgi:hypothetical protein
VLAGSRLSEAVELYESLGFEVLLVPLLDESGVEGQNGACTSCFGSDPEPGRFKVVYTRPGARPKPGGSDQP